MKTFKSLLFHCDVTDGISLMCMTLNIAFWLTNEKKKLILRHFFFSPFKRKILFYFSHLPK